MPETAPCPWCKNGGKPFLHKTRTPDIGYTIHCTTCHAEGPHVPILANPCDRDWNEKVKAAQDEALKKWNARRVDPK